MNRYPAWRYVVILIALIFGVIFTLPNFFGESPAVQVSSLKATVKVDEDTVRIRGPIDAESDRTEILRIVTGLAEGRTVLDDLECPELDTNVHTERLS